MGDCAVSEEPCPYPPDGAYWYYRDIALPAVEAGREWHWTLRLKNDASRMVGAINLIRGGRSNRGFWLGWSWQRHGLMSEACVAVTDYWFGALGFDVLRVSKAAANVASRLISERHGMKLVATGESDYVCGHLPSETWEISSADWRARRKMPGGLR